MALFAFHGGALRGGRRRRLVNLPQTIEARDSPVFIGCPLGGDDVAVDGVHVGLHARTSISAASDVVHPQG